MPWIESHPEIESHPKTFDLMDDMGWDIDTTVGKLHRLWWWCTKYAEDGDLRKHSDSRIAMAMGVATSDAKRLVEALVRACWLDREPYFRVHDWWNYFGSYLLKKYAKKREKWEVIRQQYESSTATGQKPGSPAVPALPDPPEETKTEKTKDSRSPDGAADLGSLPTKAKKTPKTAKAGEETTPHWHETLEYICTAWTRRRQEATNETVPFSIPPQDLPKLKAHMRIFPAAQTMALWDVFLKSKQVYAKQRAYSVEAFLRMINQLTDDPDYKRLLRIHDEQINGEFLAQPAMGLKVLR